MEIELPIPLKETMNRCSNCSGIVTKTETNCYLCGEPVPGRSEFFLFRLFAKKPARDATRATDRVMRNDGPTTPDRNGGDS